MPKRSIKRIAGTAVGGLVALALLVGCGDKKDKDGSKAGAAKTEETDSVAVCAKAKHCVEALLAADPDNTKDLDTTLAGVVSLPEGAEKLNLCKQLLDGARYNPKSPPECK